MKGDENFYKNFFEYQKIIYLYYIFVFIILNYI